MVCICENLREDGNYNNLGLTVLKIHSTTFHSFYVLIDI